MTIERLALWKQAQVGWQGVPTGFSSSCIVTGCIRTRGRGCGEAFGKFMEDLVGGAPERKETLHFVSAREMTNILLAACDGRGGTRRLSRLSLPTIGGGGYARKFQPVPVSQKG